MKKALVKTVLFMKLTVILLTVALHATAAGLSQGITLSEKNVPVVKVLKSIRQQSGYDFFYNNKTLELAGNVSIEVTNAPIEQALEQVFKNTPLTFSISAKLIVINKRDATAPPVLPPAPATAPPPPLNIHGRLVNEDGEPVAGVSIKVKGTSNGTTTNGNGEFTLTNVDDQAILVFTATNIESFEQKVKGKTEFFLSAKIKVGSMEEVVVNKGYYKEKQRLSTGNVTKVTSKEIERQPVTNVLSALQGRVAGLVITQNTGLPGGSFTVQIRGQNSFNGNDPFYVIDGVPYNSQLPFASGSYAIINNAPQARQSA